MLLKKTVSAEGQIEITLNGQELDLELSRLLTGTTGEEEKGIFNGENSAYFEFGDFRNRIIFQSFLDFCWQFEDIYEVIQTRVDQVRAWVQDCRDSGGEGEISTNDVD